MKFYCDTCNTKYAISDEKVRGKVLKVRCKKCENIITVREARTPDAPSAPSKESGVPQTNWYFAVNGVTTGPLDLADIRSKFATGEVGDEAYVWHDSFDKWEPVAAVDTFEKALATGQALKPRAKTLGFTGKLEAVKAPEGANKSKAGTVPRPSPSKPDKSVAPKPAAKESTAKAASPKSVGESPAARAAPREDKLAALRAKLKAKQAQDSAARPAVPIGLSEAKTPEKPALPEPESSDFDIPATAVAAPDLSDIPTPSTSSAEGSNTAGESDALPRVSPALEGTPSTTSTSDIFEIPAPIDDDEASDEQDSVPFFPAAEVAKPAPAEQSALTGSLLIQLDQIHKKGRGSKLFAVAVIIMFLGVAGAVGAYIATQPKSDGENVFTKSEGPGSGEHRELNFNTYSDDQQKKILELGDEEISMEFDESETGTLEGDAPKAVEKEESSKKVVEKRVEKTARETNGAAKLPAAEREPAEKEGKTLALARIKDEPSNGNPSAEATRAKAEMFRSATSSAKRETGEIARPEDKLQGSVNPNATLTREQALAGMKRVSRSVQLCRERHMRRGGAFDSPKVFVTVTVNGDGRVGKFDAEPSALENTEFGRCMNSHKGRWRFAAFGGKPQQVRRRFIIQ